MPPRGEKKKKKNVKVWNEDLVLALQAREELCRQQYSRKQYMWRDGAAAIASIRKDIYLYQYKNGSNTDKIVGLPRGGDALTKSVDDECRAIIQGKVPVLPVGYHPKTTDEHRLLTITVGTTNNEDGDDENSTSNPNNSKPGSMNPYHTDPYLNKIKMRGGSYAILMALHHSSSSSGSSSMTKTQLCKIAQNYCDEEMEPNFAAGRAYGAWSSKKTLLKHGLIKEIRTTQRGRSGQICNGVFEYMVTQPNGLLFIDALVTKFHPTTAATTTTINNNTISAALASSTSTTTNNNNNKSGNNHTQNPSSRSSTANNAASKIVIHNNTTTNNGSIIMMNTKNNVVQKNKQYFRSSSSSTKSCFRGSMNNNNNSSIFKKDEVSLRQNNEKSKIKQKKNKILAQLKDDDNDDDLVVLLSSDDESSSSSSGSDSSSDDDNDDGLAGYNTSSKATTLFLQNKKSIYNNNNNSYINNNNSKKELCNRSKTETKKKKNNNKIINKNIDFLLLSSSDDESTSSDDADDDSFLRSTTATANIVYVTKKKQQQLQLQRLSTTKKYNKAAQVLPDVIDLVDSDSDIDDIDDIDNDTNDDDDLNHSESFLVRRNTSKTKQTITTASYSARVSSSSSPSSIVIIKNNNKENCRTTNNRTPAKALFSPSMKERDSKRTNSAKTPSSMMKEQNNNSMIGSKGQSDITTVAAAMTLVVIIDNRERNRNATPRAMRMELMRHLSSKESGPLRQIWPANVPIAEVEEAQLNYGDFMFALQSTPSAATVTPVYQKRRRLPVSIERKRLSDLVQRSYRADHWKQLQRMRDCCDHAILLIEGNTKKTSNFSFPGGGDDNESSTSTWNPDHHTIDDEHAFYRFVARGVLSSPNLKILQAKDEQASYRSIGAVGLVASSLLWTKNAPHMVPYTKITVNRLYTKMKSRGIPWQIARRVSEEVGSIDQLNRIYNYCDNRARSSVLVPIIKESCSGMIQENQDSHRSLLEYGKVETWSAAIHSAWYTTLDDPTTAVTLYEENKTFANDRAQLLTALHRGKNAERAIRESNIVDENNIRLVGAEDEGESVVEGSILPSTRRRRRIRRRQVRIESTSKFTNIFPTDDETETFYETVCSAENPLGMILPTVVLQTTSDCLSFQSDKLVMCILEGFDFVNRICECTALATIRSTTKEVNFMEISISVAKQLDLECSSYLINPNKNDRRVLLIRGLGAAMTAAAKDVGYRPEYRVLSDLIVAQLMLRYNLVVIHAPRLTGDLEMILREFAMGCFHYQLTNRKLIH